jgi:hypothetical protein
VAKDEEAYISSKCRLFPTGEDSFLAYNFLSHSCQVISRNLLNILRITDHFRTVEGHKKSLIEAGWQDDGSGYIENSITELAKRGLLVARTSFLSHLHKPSSTDHPPPITSIVWPTRDRNQLLERGMKSYIENNRQYSRDTRFVVLDDSRSENTSKDLYHILTSLRAQDIPVCYAGLQDKLTFIGELLYAGKSSGLTKDIVEFAFFGPNKPHNDHTLGGNLNALLLATRGQLVLVTDDDMICQATVFDEQKIGLVLSSCSDPTDFQFYQDREELRASHRFQEIDILHWHETLLGQTVSQFISQRQDWDSIDVNTASPEMVHRLLTEQMRVCATMTGVRGDSGMGSQQFLLGMTGSNRDRLMQSESIYTTAKTSRQLLRYVPCTTISDGSLLMSGNMGIDNRDQLPPFFPIGRNADGLFATILTMCYSNNLIGHLPLALLHNPTTDRKISPDEFFDVRLRMTDIMSLIVRTFAVPANYTDKEKGLRSLGKYLLDIGNLPLQQFEEFIRLLWLESSAKKLEYLDFLLDVYRSQPDFWARDVDYLKKEIKNASVEEQAYLPMDLPVSHLGNEGISIFRELVADFGSLLIWWPTILHLTEELLSDNTTLARAAG